MSNSTAGSPSTAGAGAGSNALPEPQHHRPGAIVCDDERPYGEIYSGLGGDCESHADCTNGRNGRCDNTSGSVPYTVCTYDECLKDADCGSGRVCECQGGRGSDFNACVDGNCRIDADCPDSWCSPSPGVCGPSYGTEAYFCRTAKDECSNDSDCGTSNDGEPGFCMYDADVAHWVCMYGQCVG